MDSSQDELGNDNENNRTVFLRKSDPFLPMIPSPEIKEEPLEGGLNTPPVTPLHSPHAFLKEDRWLFSPPPVLTVAPTKLDNFKTEFSSTPMTQRHTSEPSTTIEIEHFEVHLILLVRLVTLPVGTEPTIWKPPPLLQTVSIQHQIW